MTAVSCQQELPRLIRRMPEGQPKEILSRLRGLTQRCVNSVHLDLIVIFKMFKSMSSPGSLIEKKDRIYEVLNNFLFTNKISSGLIILYLEIESRCKAWYNAFWVLFITNEDPVNYPPKTKNFVQDLNHVLFVCCL